MSVGGKNLFTRGIEETGNHLFNKLSDKGGLFPNHLRILTRKIPL